MEELEHGVAQGVGYGLAEGVSVGLGLRVECGRQGEGDVQGEAGSCIDKHDVAPKGRVDGAKIITQGCYGNKRLFMHSYIIFA